MIADPTLRIDVIDLFASYAACLDSGCFQEWVEFFTEDAWYRIISRENYDRKLPLSTVSLHGVPMMRDRIYGIESTIFHAPHYQRHIIGPTRIIRRDGYVIETETNYVVFRTKRDMPADIFNAGVYIDKINITPGGLKFSEKFCVFDNDLIPNSLIYPI